MKTANFIAAKILKNEHESQFSMNELLDGFEGQIPDKRYIRSKLIEIMGDTIVITPAKYGENDYIISYMCNTDNLLSEKWYKNKINDDDEKKQRLADCFANIINNEIRKIVSDNNNYPSPDNFLEGIENQVPPLLYSFLEKVICNKKVKSTRLQNIVTCIGHAIIASTRPRSYHSPLQIALSATLYRKYGSRELIDLL